MVGQVGLEPTTALSTGFTVRGDTNYTVLTHMVWMERFELPTNCFVGSYSIPLSYIHILCLRFPPRVQPMCTLGIASEKLRNQDIINAGVKHYCKDEQIVYRGQCSSVLPFVDGLGRIETENYLQVVNGQACGLSQINNIGAGLRQIDGWNRQPKHLLF